MTGEVMIECEGLTKRFGHFTAVDHVSFRVTKGFMVLALLDRLHCNRLLPIQSASNGARLQIFLPPTSWRSPM